MQIYTSRWNAGNLIIGSGCNAVSISLGVPKFPLAFPTMASIPELMPHGSWLQIPEPEYRVKYLAKLEKVGVPWLMVRLQEVSEKNPEGKIALLCWENLAKGDWCHRRMFAEWWEEKTGMVVEELGQRHLKVQPPETPLKTAKKAEKPPKARQIGLFDEENRY